MILPQKRACIILGCLLFLCHEVICNENTLINFHELSLRQAGASGKRIMVSFTADWCLPCKVMSSTLYSDPEIADLVNDNFQPVMIDVDSSLGESWNENYNIELLPSILFTDPTGIEFERIKGAPSKDEFKKILRRIIETVEVPYRPHNHTNSTASAVELGLAIQLGAFSTLASAERRKNHLSAYKDEDYLIIQEETKGRILYKVIHEGVSSKAESVSLLSNYHKNGFEAFLRPD